LSGFQCSSASRKFLNRVGNGSDRNRDLFQCSSASRKFLNADHGLVLLPSALVSVLFSEPKISQYRAGVLRERKQLRFSALQRAENFSIRSSPRVRRDPPRFSALQRAENFSIRRPRRAPVAAQRFQCSSASRKFLNRITAINPVSVTDVSVLFSEPKISQFEAFANLIADIYGFQCSSASRKFLNTTRPRQTRCRCWVSVLFSEPKISQSIEELSFSPISFSVSVLFSEPKISQSPECDIS